MNSNETALDSRQCPKKRALHESLLLSHSSSETKDGSNNSNSIIGIPTDDFRSLTTTKKPRNSNTTTHNNSSNNSSNNSEEDELLLLQLPIGLSMKDLISSSNNNHNKNRKKKEYSGTASQLVVSSLDPEGTSSSRCTLVTDDQSFDLVRVETSNAYVLVPPAAATTTVPWKGRLLSETNTYFLECQATSPLLDLQRLQQQLQRSSGNSSIAELAHGFGSSLGQVQSSLWQLVRDQYHVHFHHNDKDQQVSILPKDQVQSILSGIMDTLSEWDGASNCTDAPISIPLLIPHILQRLPSKPSHPYTNKKDDDPNQFNSILANTLRLLSNNNNNNNNNNNPFSNDDHVQIDPIKVARVIARILLEQQPTWESMEEFVAVWQRRMPGVMDVPSTDWSPGILLSTPDSSASAVEYYPETALSLSIAQRMEQLFQKRDKWCLSQLFPYLQRFTCPTQIQQQTQQQQQQSIATILLQYTVKTTDEQSQTWYTLKASTTASNP